MFVSAPFMHFQLKKNNLFEIESVGMLHTNTFYSISKQKNKLLFFKILANLITILTQI